MVRLALLFLLLVHLSTTAHATKRVALVIGNSTYQHAPELRNPKNDATDVTAALRKFGVQVFEGLDLDKGAMERKIRDFAIALQGAQAGIFFYAGHGLQVAGQNYLVPVDAQGTTASALDFEMVRLDLVHRTMERETNTNILFLDACRDNPLARKLARAMGTRSSDVGRGLAAVESGFGTPISFSTQPGNVALDGAGRNSPFTGALIKHLVAPNDDLSAILIAVRNNVMKETLQKQVPWEHSALTARFYFAPQTEGKPPLADPRPPQAGPQVSELFSPEDMRRLKAIADRKQLPLPSFQMYSRGNGVPESARQFVGIWITDKGSDKSRRQYGLIISDVTEQGLVLGYQLLGPPQAKSLPTPAAHYALFGQITDGKIFFKGGSTDNVVERTAQNRILMTQTLSNGTVTKILLESVWQLVEVERTVKR